MSIVFKAANKAAVRTLVQADDRLHTLGLSDVAVRRLDTAHRICEPLVRENLSSVSGSWSIQLSTRTLP